MLCYTNKILRYAASYHRILLSATLGAIWAVMVQISSGIVRNIFHVCTYLIISYAMVAVISGTYKLKKNIKGMVVLYLITFCLSGVINIFMEYTNAGKQFGNKILSSPMLIIYVVIAVVIIKICAHSIVGITEISSYTAKMKISVAGVEFDVNGLIDTGNSLRDPYNGKPVCILDRMAVPDNLYISSKEKLHYIPISSVGCENGVIQVFTAEKCEIYNNGKIISVSNVLIGISDTVISHGNDYEMLINPLIIKIGDNDHGVKSSSRR